MLRAVRQSTVLVPSPRFPRRPRIYVVACSLFFAVGPPHVFWGGGAEGGG
jgi:hypothetical protein